MPERRRKELFRIMRRVPAWDGHGDDYRDVRHSLPLSLRRFHRPIADQEGPKHARPALLPPLRSGLEQRPNSDQADEILTTRAKKKFLSKSIHATKDASGRAESGNKKRRESNEK